MSGIKSKIELYDAFSSPMLNIVNAVNMGASAVEDMQHIMNGNINTASIQNMSAQMQTATNAANELEAAIQNIGAPSEFSPLNIPQDLTVDIIPEVAGQPQIDNSAVEVPVVPVVGSAEIETPEDVTVNVIPEITEQPQVDNSEIVIPVTPEITEQPQIETPNDLTVDVTPIVTEQPVIDTSGVEIPVEPVVTEQPIVDIPQDLTVDIIPEVAPMPDLDIPDSIAINAEAVVTTVETDLPDPVEIPATMPNPPPMDAANVQQYANAVNAINNMLEAVVANQRTIEAQGSNISILPPEEKANLTEIQRAIAETQQAVVHLQNTPIETDTEGVQLQLARVSESISTIIGKQNELNQAMQSMQMPDWKSDNLEVFSTSGIERFEQEIESTNSFLNNMLEIQGQISSKAENMSILPPQAQTDIESLFSRIQALQTNIQQIEDNSLDVGSDEASAQLERLRMQLSQLIGYQENLNSAMQSMNVGDINNAYMQLSQNVSNVERNIRDSFSQPVEIPITWNSPDFDIFLNSGVERFEQEIQSANTMLNTLNSTQQTIIQTAASTNLFPANAIADMSNMQGRLQAIQQQIELIENNPINMGTDEANAELERLRGLLNQAVQQQEEMNSAVQNMDVQAANEAYLRLSNTVDNTEIYIRENINAQGTFNRLIQQGTDNAAGLQSMIKRALGAFAGIAGVRKAFSFIEDCTEAFDTQLNAETQLMGVLANMLDADYVSQFELETSADTTGAIEDINAIQNSISAVEIPVTAESKALNTAFDKITEKASEIQSQGIYGDEAMIAAGAEFATYFTDVDAITTMMDTLSNYAMGMSGGGEIDSTAMVDYATNLGKIMSGSYDAMTKKGFEFTDAQKAIIEGEATEAQIVEALGAEYLDMSSDMQAAAAITQVIDESWAGLYQTMSNTPQGKIIQLTNKWGDMKEVIGQQLYPAVIRFVDIINKNWGTISKVVDGITSALQTLLTVLSWVLEGAISVAEFFVNNWSWIAPIIGGITTALIAYHGWQVAVNAVQLISKGIKAALIIAEYAHAAATGAEVAATTAATAAQMGLNTALLACPITWILVAIIAIVAALYAAVGAVNQIAGTTISATGLIAAAIFTIGAYIINNFILAWNIVSAFVEFLVNVWHHPKYAIKAFLVNVTSAFLNFALACINGTQSAVGTIVGLWHALSQAIANIIVVIYNFFADGIEAIVNGWNTGIYNIKTFFIGLASAAMSVASSILSSMGQAASGIANMFISAINVAIGALNGLVDAMNAIPGVNIGKVSELGQVSFDFGTSALQDTASDLLSEIGDAPEKWEAPELSTGDVGDAFVDGYMIGQDMVSGAQDTLNGTLTDMQNMLGDKPEDYWEAPKIDYIDLSDAAVTGYEWGEGLENKVSDMFNPEYDVPSVNDIASELASAIDPNAGSGGLGNDVGDIADNTGAIADSVSTSDEELKYLRDIAERDVVNRYTTAEITINQENHNNISSDADLDGIVSDLTDAMEEAAEIATEGE